MLKEFLANFVEQHQLPKVFTKTAIKFYAPLAERLRGKLGDQTYVLGINGSQGAGKSTLADFLKQYLEQLHNLNVVCLSIDDIYLTRAERQSCAQSIHPLLATRGVPGTHDVSLGLELIDGLKTLAEGQQLMIPRFDKLADDRCPAEQYSQTQDPVNLIIFEGWCVGSLAQSADQLKEPVNSLESEEDTDGRWRYFVNQKLEQEYARLFGNLDSLIMLKAPSFDLIFEWRLKQEQKMADTLSAVTGADMPLAMNQDEILRFIQHYERITRHNLAVLPEIADVLLELGEDHQVSTASYRSF